MAELEIVERVRCLDVNLQDNKAQNMIRKIRKRDIT